MCANSDSHGISAQILEKAKHLGASQAGWAAIEDLKASPSVAFAPTMPYRRDAYDTTGHLTDKQLGLKPGEVHWPANAKSVLVISCAHPGSKPELDWWLNDVLPEGNRMLMTIVRELCQWIGESFGVGTFHLPYAVGKGGFYLKDAAVLAGLGCIGKNNLLITPEFGPRVRLRALTVDAAIPATGPVDFDPCKACDAPCRRACPVSAMDHKIYESCDYQGLENLPGRDGGYDIVSCDRQMEKDLNMAETVFSGKTKNKIVKYCRNCELACPVGRAVRFSGEDDAS